MRTLIVVATLTTPFALGLALNAGCTSSKPAVVPAPSTSVSATEAGVMVAPVDAAPEAAAMTVDAGDANIWAPVLASGDAAGEAGAAAACWKGFTPTGNAEADVAELGNRCAVSQGMSPLIPPVKHTFKQGETKSIPVAIVPGCYRVIAVGGKGVKDVDLALKDNAGKIVAADLTPDDVFPMIHPNKEFCAESVQFLNLTISVKKGAGEVAGGVWKR
jgi:hypothetical protein